VNSVTTSTVTQTDLAEFLKNPENAREVNGLVEDIHYALTDYQVRTPRTTRSYHTQHPLQTSLRLDIYDEGCQQILSFTPL